MIDVECETDAILKGIRLATSAEFRHRLAGVVNPYGDGHAAGRIVDVLSKIELDNRLIVKRFHDIAVPMPVKASER